LPWTSNIRDVHPPKFPPAHPTVVHHLLLNPLVEKGPAMRLLMAVITSASLVLSLVVTAEAASKRSKQRTYDSYAQRYPSATPRQLQNLRAYERGEYYETLSTALPVGSRPWFEQKEREGNRFPF
jgi:hypothetical protein